MFRVVLDTNVLVSAIISNGKSRELLKKGIAKQYLPSHSSWLEPEYQPATRSLRG